MALATSVAITLPAYANRYSHHSDGLWLLAIPVVLLAVWVLKIVLTLIAGGAIALFDNLGRILGAFGQGILAVLGGFGFILLFLLKIVLLVVGMFLVIGPVMALFYWIGHFFGYAAEGIGLLAGLIIGLLIYSKLAKLIEKATNK